MNLFGLSWKSVLYKPWSTLLSVLLFALGIGLVVFLFLLQKQVQDNFKKNMAGIDLVIGAKGSPLQLVMSSMYHIDAPTGNISLKDIRPFLKPKHPFIEQAVPMALGDSYRGYRIVGTTNNFLSLYNAEVATGKIWENDLEVTAGAAVADALGLKIGDEFHSSHGFDHSDHATHDDTSLKIVGILKPTGSIADQLLLTTPQSFWITHSHGTNKGKTASLREEIDAHSDHDHDHHHDHDHTHQHDNTITHKHDNTALLDAPDDAEITSILIKYRGHSINTLNMPRKVNEKKGLQAASPAIELNRLYSLMGNAEMTLKILAWLIIVVSGLSVFIALLSSLRKRRYELAIMRTMGGSRRQLFTLIILEGLLIAFLGYLLGLLLGHFGMYLMANNLEDAYRYSFSTRLFLVQEVWLLFAALLLGFLAALLPAAQAALTDISQTLSRDN